MKDFNLAAAMSDPATQRSRLLAIIKEKSFSVGDEIKLASGRSSSFYFNMKPTMMDPEGAALIGALVYEQSAALKADYIGGLEMGAVPIVSVVSPASYLLGAPLPAFFVRKKTKEHGTQALIEGLPPGESLDGKSVIIAEDVTTTGGSSLKAVETVRAAGGSIALVITLVDRQEGAVEAFGAKEIPFKALFNAEEFKQA